MFKTIILSTILLLCITSATVLAQGTNGPVANSSSARNVSVTTNTLVLAYDGTRLHWNLHPESSTGIRCEPGLFNKQDSSITPTTTIGEEFIGNGYFDNAPFTPAFLSLRCTAESGTVVVSVWEDFL